MWFIYGKNQCQIKEGKRIIIIIDEEKSKENYSL